ncbi:MAG: tRNA uridine-5-carboxymethylaminomethyl(34) synthesis GTPase MnmE [Desulfobacula sp.]|nr:tRNA uridine-5-carboxymethylaminomethyl(34) synthesis GTPase MnmE [Desulfobacula sp.]
MNDTIAAIATPYGSGGIGVIRISGPLAFDVAKRVFSRKNDAKSPLHTLISHRVIHGFIIHPETPGVLKTSGVPKSPDAAATLDVIDEVLMIPMKGPKSYTAEDVVEIQAHSGSVVLRTLLDLILLQGVRLAEPGEFTKRAFLNGRIDLTQAEAVADIINAKSARSLKIAASQNLGALKQKIKNLRERLIDLLSFLEANIDFPDDVAQFEPSAKEMAMIDDVIAQCIGFIQQYDDACFLKDGIRLTICGAPNVGKSSLMNQLLEHERSIVTAVPGTTRDPIEEVLNIEGIPFVVIDTAGIHQTDDLVEIIGIEKAKDHIVASDLVLYLKEPGSKFSDLEFEQIVPLGKKAIFVINKIDLGEDDLPKLSEKYQDIPTIEISALQDIGIKTLRQKIVNLCIAELDMEKSSVVPNLRHKKALEETVCSLEMVRSGLAHGQEEETLAMDIKNSIDSLGTITGETASLDILDAIFNNFCIGK